MDKFKKILKKHVFADFEETDTEVSPFNIHHKSYLQRRISLIRNSITEIRQNSIKTKNSLAPQLI